MAETLTAPPPPAQAKPAAPTPPPSPPAKPFPNAYTMPEICTEELQCTLAIAHVRSVVGSEGDTVAGTADIIEALGEVFEGRATHAPKDHKAAWTDLANAIKAVAELSRHLELK